ncbi:MAG: DNA polymerase III subunit chi [Nitrosomonas sp.]|nr:DNA polymerase III subunit chi [Nitrosomonas sp.]
MVTQVDFYTGTANKLLIACRLCEKAMQKKLKTLVDAPDASVASQFDRLLWTFSPTSFVPHCLTSDKLSGITPVVLCAESIQTDVDRYDVLLNLGAEVPRGAGFSKRIIEVVDETDLDKQLARKRYRHYQAQGYDVRHHRL